MPDLPAATLTFLFTDIEGSTRRWEHVRAAMANALARHDALLRAAIEGHGGQVLGSGATAALARSDFRCEASGGYDRPVSPRRAWRHPRQGAMGTSEEPGGRKDDMR